MNSVIERFTCGNCETEVEPLPTARATTALHA